MLLLIVFAFVAGAATAVSPCVLPVLPVVLTAGVTSGRRRPLGIVTGLAVSFTFATVALVYVIDALGLPDDLLRRVAIVVLLLFGISLLVPWLSARVEAWLSRLTARAPVRGGGDGFWTGVLLGASLGLVYAPCAGPILAGVITVSAAQEFTADRLIIAFAYGIGTAVVLYALMLGGRRLTARLAHRTGRFQSAMGLVMVLVAVAMLADLDMRFENAVAAHAPTFLANPTHGLESTSAAKRQLAKVRARGHGDAGNLGAAPETEAPERADASAAASLRDLGAAPEFVGNQRWFNTAGGRPLTLERLRGRVVLVDFWTYSCINCLRTLPYLKGWDRKYRRDGLVIVGVHSPEFPFEKKASNVAAAIGQNGIRYPVAQDNDLATWDAYGNQYWPAEYFIDARGHVRFVHFGEGEYEGKERVIRALLAEAGEKHLGSETRTRATAPSNAQLTPESYLGAARADRFVNGAITGGRSQFGAPVIPPPDHLAYSGTWRISGDSATAGADAGLILNFRARRVYLVLGSPGETRSVRLLLDGRPVTAKVAGKDVRDGVVRVGEERLYALIDLPQVGDHVLTLKPDAGVAGYAFTFG